VCVISSVYCSMVKSRSFPNMHMIEAEAKGCDNAGKEERLQGGGDESRRKKERPIRFVIC
jgi:hypothetical protein